MLKTFFKQICRGLDAIHNEAGYAHLDLKPDKIFIGNDLQLKISGLNYAHKINGDITNVKGTVGYQAPEVIAVDSFRQPYQGVLADIFSLGVLFFYMRTGKLPFARAILEDQDF